jgi:poly [ADP-ribose] polymerase 6/8
MCLFRYCDDVITAIEILLSMVPGEMCASNKMAAPVANGSGSGMGYFDLTIDEPMTLDVAARHSRNYHRLARHAENNVLMKIVMALEGEILTCTQRCLCCNKPVDRLESTGARPIVCADPLCLLQFEDMGVGLDIACELKRDPVVFDLYISCLYAAASSGGRISLSFPRSVTAPNPNGGMTTFLNADGTENSNAVLTVLTRLPSTSEMLHHAHDKHMLKGFLDEIDTLLYPLLRWLISGNRSHMRLLPAAERPPALATCGHIFVLQSGPIEKESLFQSFKRQSGSLLAFHGSPVGNWHPILRNGVKNFSYTPLMTAGAAYGTGAYFAKESATSLGYCRAVGSWWPKSVMRGQNVIALCELINRPKEFTKTDPYYVVPQEQYITTRYLVVDMPPDSRIVASTVAIPK